MNYFNHNEELCLCISCMPYQLWQGHTLSIASIRAHYIEILSYYYTWMSCRLLGTRAVLCTSVLVTLYSSIPLHELEIVITGHISPEYRLNHSAVFTTKQSMLCVQGIWIPSLWMPVLQLEYNKISLTPLFSWCYQLQQVVLLLMLMCFH